MFILKKILKHLIFFGAVFSGFLGCTACHPGIPHLQEYLPRTGRSTTSIRLDNLLIAIGHANVDHVKLLIDGGIPINQQGEPVTMLVQAILSFNADTNSDNLIRRFQILKLLLDAGAEINNDTLTKVEDVQDKQLKVKIANFLEINLLQSPNVHYIIDNAIKNDYHLIIKILLKSNKIRLENLKELLQKSKNVGSKKVGRLLLGVLRLIDFAGGISTTGICSWDPCENDSELPNEIIDIIARLNA